MLSGNFSISCIDAKTSVIDAMQGYTKNKFKFFMFGPQHVTRAKAVVAAVSAANDVESIIAILNHQNEILSGMSSVYDQDVNPPMDARWTRYDNVKNPPRSHSKFNRILAGLVKSLEKRKIIKPSTPSLYDQILKLGV